MSLPFFPDLHTEAEKEWKNSFPLAFIDSSYANIVGMHESGYERMPPIEETLASYLSMGEMSYLMVPSLPYKPLQDTLRLNGKAYAAAARFIAHHGSASSVPSGSAERPG